MVCLYGCQMHRCICNFGLHLNGFQSHMGWAYLMACINHTWDGISSEETHKHCHC